MFNVQLVMVHREVTVQFWFVPQWIFVGILNEGFHFEIFEYAGDHKILEISN